MSADEEEAIRRDERRRIAAVLENNANAVCVLMGEASSRAVLSSVVFFLRLGLTEAERANGSTGTGSP